VQNKKLYRIIDANLNRSREGLRVIEDIVRFYTDDKKITSLLKKTRHEITDTAENNRALLSWRDAYNDAGKGFVPSLEGKDKDITGIIVSNFKRVEESLRVLEEISKILMPRKTFIFKDLRFRVYTIEKKVFKKFEKKK
jgi:thiamine-phosphate pyrophosphorylase